MLPLRQEITDYSRSCEHLIFAASSPDAVPFTQDEIDWITYYTAEMTKLVDLLARTSKSQVLHDRETLQEFAAASEALFLTDGLSEGERNRIRRSLSDVTTEIVHKLKDPASEP
jgi:hypothetical protein